MNVQSEIIRERQIPQPPKHPDLTAHLLCTQFHECCEFYVNAQISPYISHLHPLANNCYIFRSLKAILNLHGIDLKFSQPCT